MSFGMTQMMGSPMQLNKVIFHAWLTMKYKRKTNRAVYHITRLTSSLRASLNLLASVVMRDTSTPERKVGSLVFLWSEELSKNYQRTEVGLDKNKSLVPYGKNIFHLKITLCCQSFTSLVGIKETYILFQHGLEDNFLHRGVDVAHGDVVDEVTYKLQDSAGTHNRRHITV